MAGSRRRYTAAPLDRRLYRQLRRAPLPGFVKRRLWPHGVFTLTLDDGHTFVMRSRGEYIENDLRRWGYGQGWEAASLRVWARLARNAATVIDVGALRGVYALAAKAANPQARVVAFEPIEPSYQRLVENAVLNGFEITAERFAVSDRAGSARMYDSVGAGHALASLARPPKVAYTEIDVPTTTLDEYFESHPPASVDLVKIDVEGHETAVLRGMAGLLAASKPTVLVEILTQAAVVEVLDTLSPYGYDAYRVSEHDGLEPLGDDIQRVKGSRNYLFCTPDDFAATHLSDLLLRS